MTAFVCGVFLYFNRVNVMTKSAEASVLALERKKTNSVLGEFESSCRALAIMLRGCTILHCELHPDTYSAKKSKTEEP